MAVLNSLDIDNASALNVNVWSRLLFMEALNSTFVGRFMGEGPNALFTRHMDLSRGPGDTIRFDMLSQVAGFGVNGVDQLKGSEANLSYDQNTLVIDSKRQATAHFRTSQQRTVHDLRMDAMRALKDWFARVMDEHVAAQATGDGIDTGAGTVGEDVGNFGGAAALHDYTAEAGTPHYIDQSAASITPSMISDAKWLAAASPSPNGPIRPVRIEGQEYYVMFLHPAQAKALQQHDDWQTAQQQANVRGNANPIFTGALGLWDGVILHAWNHLPTPAAPSDVKIAVLCGAGSVSIGFGRSFSVLDSVNRGSTNDDGFPVYWVEEVEDYGFELGVSAGLIWGTALNVFQAEAFATVRLDTLDTLI